MEFLDSFGSQLSQQQHTMTTTTNTQIPADIFPCDKTCVASPKNGGSWWKNNGYNFPCECAWKCEKKKIEMKILESNRSQISQQQHTMTTTTEQCKCTDFMDIRGRCQPTDASWAKCPAKVDTAYFCLNNCYEDYKKFCLETVGTRAKRNKKARKIASVKYGLTEDELDGIDELFAQDDANEEEFQCRFCCKPIALEDEDTEGKYDHCEDCWVCYDCYDEHYCATCKGYSDEELTKEKGWKCEECAE